MISYNKGRFYICRTMRAAKIDIWDIITTTDRWSDWGPMVCDVECDTNRIQEGSVGRIQTIFFFWLVFEVTEFNDKLSWTWRVANINATGHTLYFHSPLSCTLCFDVPWWAFLYIPVCWLALWRISKMCGTKKELPGVLFEPTN